MSSEDNCDHDAEVLERRTCRLPGCGGPASGVCINNLSFDDCPDVVLVDLGNLSETTLRPPRTHAELVLPGGHAFDAAACDALLRQRGGTVVGLVAGPKVGKTTLISLMYELLARRRMVGFRFAGSETLRGYEERCHLARLLSEAEKAETARTPTINKLSFTHLRVAQNEKRLDVVFSDRAGEHFQRVMDRPNDIATFAELQRADVILLMVDLVELMRDLYGQTSQMRRWFIAMAQNGVLDDKPILLVGTKADVALSTPNRSKAGAKALSDLGKNLSHRLPGATVQPHIIACRPRKGSTDVGEGVEALLDDILSPKPMKSYTTTEIWPVTPTELDLLMRPFRMKST